LSSRELGRSNASEAMSCGSNSSIAVRAGCLPRTRAEHAAVHSRPRYSGGKDAARYGDEGGQGRARVVGAPDELGDDGIGGSGDRDGDGPGRQMVGNGLRKQRYGGGVPGADGPASAGRFASLLGFETGAAAEGDVENRAAAVRPRAERAGTRRRECAELDRLLACERWCDLASFR
jgi:hypothetical protein